MDASTTGRRRWRALGAVAVLAMATALLPSAASATSHEPDFQPGPTNGCPLGLPEAPFADRAAAAEVHQPSIDCMAHQGITTGRDGRYFPAESVTRGQMASFIARTLDAAGDRDLPASPADRFGDTAGNVHEHRINQLAEIGVVSGRTADRYEPNGLVSREQMASFLVRALAWNHGATYGPVGDSPYFLDIGGSVHADAIRAGYELWLFEGREPGSYDPTARVSRDAMATFLRSLLNLVHPDRYLTDNQSYVMSPMEPVTADPETVVEFSVDASLREFTTGPEPIPGPVRQALHLALFPCANVDWDELPATFSGDEVASGIGQSDGGHAYFTEVNGEPTMGRVGLVQNAPPVDGRITFSVGSFAAQEDCAIIVAFDDRPPVDELRLDAGGRPVSPYGFVAVRWQNG